MTTEDVKWFNPDRDPDPEPGRPVMVKWKTSILEQRVEDAYDIPDDYWFAEVRAWRYADE